MLNIHGRELLLDGEKFNIYSGAMHYFRILPEYWEDRLLKLKAAGFNTVETYVAWNVHEPNKGEFCFEGRYDIIQFLKTAQKVGLYTIVRPGPYICAEWDLGGFPAWLLKDDSIQFRCYDEHYLHHVRDYFDVLLPLLQAEQITKGGSIIAMQVENEYGSFGTDKKYLNALRDMMREHGIDVTLFTSDGESKYHFSGGGLRDEWVIANFGSFPKVGLKELAAFQPNKPLMCGEYWCGWFDHFGERHHGGAAGYLEKILKEFFEQDASFNFYMFHGGTNFGFMGGANYSDHYMPTTTSYDYSAPLNEHGGYTAKYHTIRKVLCQQQGIALPPLPADVTLQTIGSVTLTQCAGFHNNLSAIALHHHDHILHHMEHYNQSYGFILYHTQIEGDYHDTVIRLNGVHDVAYVYINGKKVGRCCRFDETSKGRHDEIFTFPLPAFTGKCDVHILVEAMGRINFGQNIYDRKGLTSVAIGEQLLFDWDVYTIPLETLTDLVFTNEKVDCPAFIKGSFKSHAKADCYIDMTHFSKGLVFVNGFNLGRYWNIGPQRALYLPGAILKEKNEIVILELESFTAPVVEIVDHQIYKKYQSKQRRLWKKKD